MLDAPGCVLVSQSVSGSLCTRIAFVPLLMPCGIFSEDLGQRYVVVK